jgi:hypothetical protein
MLARQQAKTSLKQTKKLLRDRGWSVRRAAIILEVDYTHLARVLTGTRKSAALVARIHSLPQSPVKYHCTGFAKKFRS